MSRFAMRLQMAAHNPTSTPSPSGQAMPLGDISGWHQIFAEDFTIDAPTGSWASTDSTAVVYTGEHGGKWLAYPDGWPSTYTNGNPGYYPSQVLSVHDGVLDYYLHEYNGAPAGANVSPLITGTSQYQTYGRYSTRFKVVYNDANRLSAYYIAWLLWPLNDADWQSAESDFPEAELDKTTVNSFTHYGGSGSQDNFTATIDFTQWHTYTQEWGSGYRKYYLDGVLLGTSTNQVWSSEERWQLQTEPSGVINAGTGHILVDWAVVYSPGP